MRPCTLPFGPNPGRMQTAPCSFTCTGRPWPFGPGPVGAIQVGGHRAHGTLVSMTRDEDIRKTAEELGAPKGFLQRKPKLG